MPKEARRKVQHTMLLLQIIVEVINNFYKDLTRFDYTAKSTFERKMQIFRSFIIYFCSVKYQSVGQSMHRIIIQKNYGKYNISVINNY